jgi:L-alanine-DL-glutamate epimerase-like enolase superfamily enzyme
MGIKDVDGWSEVTDSHGSASGIEGVVKDLAPLLIGEDPRNVEALYWKLYSRTRQSVGSIISKAIGGIENALLDIKGKYYGVPVYKLFGGAIRDRISLYWSHCGTSRVRAYEHVGRLPIRSLSDVPDFAEEIRESGFGVIKTNIPIFEPEPHIYMPGFARTPGGPELNCNYETANAIWDWICAFKYALPNLSIILDLNYNFKAEGYIKIGQMLEDMGILWLEIDSYDPKSLADIRSSVRIPICSGENLYGAKQFQPFFDAYSMDIASIDVIWNGFIRSLQIAALANLYEINCTTHNYYSNLATAISAQFCACIPNFRIMEYDVDDVPWRDELSTTIPQIEDGVLTLSDGPGWGCDINEEVLHANPRKI